MPHRDRTVEIGAYRCKRLFIQGDTNNTPLQTLCPSILLCGCDEAFRGSTEWNLYLSVHARSEDVNLSNVWGVLYKLTIRTSHPIILPEGTPTPPRSTGIHTCKVNAPYSASRGPIEIDPDRPSPTLKSKPNPVHFQPFIANGSMSRAPLDSPKRPQGLKHVPQTWRTIEFARDPRGKNR
ncbi:hypothetical protein BJ165DRAFT_1403978 [Panaeolus papilionaceus]|nr:hypothetical protein BJ165DRAFT_1403978 [Panaeolus papilionaceus]